MQQQYEMELLEKIERLEQELSYEKALNRSLKVTPSYFDEHKLLRTVIDNLPHSIYIKDEKSRFILANQSAVDVMGVGSLDNLLGKTDFDFFPSQQAEVSFRDEFTVMSTGMPIINREEQKYGRLTGKTTWFLSTKVPFRDDDNNIIGIIGISRDVTELKHIREELEQVNQHLEAEIVQRTLELESEIQERMQTQDQLINERHMLRLLIDNLPDVIYVKDAESRFILANQFAAVCMGVESPDELIGKTDLDFYPEEYSKKYYDDEKNVIQSGEPLINKEETGFNLSSREITWNLATKVPFTDQNGDIIGLVGITRNISDHKEIQNSLLDLALQQERIRMLQSFIRDFSHDFKTPLSIIKTNLYLIRNNINPARLDDRLNLIEWQVTRIENMIEGILILSRLDAEVDLVRTQTDLSFLLTQILSTHQIAIAEKDIQFIVNPSELPQVALNQDVFSYAIHNIILNAIQYTPEGGQIRVHFHHTTETIQIEISDTGIGIDMGEVDKIFDHFYRVDVARNSEIGGAGLGLAIAKKAIDLHQGTIDVISTLGGGSRFAITLPIYHV